MLFGDEKILTQNVSYLALHKTFFLTRPVNNPIRGIPPLFLLKEVVGYKMAVRDVSARDRATVRSCRQTRTKTL